MLYLVSCSPAAQVSGASLQLSWLGVFRFLMIALGTRSKGASSGSLGYRRSMWLTSTNSLLLPTWVFVYCPSAYKVRMSRQRGALNGALPERNATSDSASAHARHFA